MQKQEHLITVEALRKKGRPIGKVENAQLGAYIDEVEQMYVKPALGEVLFLTLLFNKYDEEDKRYALLLDGGMYGDDGSLVPNSADGELMLIEDEVIDEDEPQIEVEQHYLTGLRTAISYYVYAQNVMTGDFQSTRYGMVVKDNDYSTHLSHKERSDAYNNALEVANNYLRECVTYCKNVGLIKTSHRVYNSGSFRIRRIG